MSSVSVNKAIKVELTGNVVSLYCDSKDGNLPSFHKLKLRHVVVNVSTEDLEELYSSLGEYLRAYRTAFGISRTRVINTDEIQRIKHADDRTEGQR